MARSGAGLLIQVFEQISFGIAHQLSDFPEAWTSFQVAPLIHGVGRKPEEGCSLFGGEQLHGKTPNLAYRFMGYWERQANACRLGFIMVTRPLTGTACVRCPGRLATLAPPAGGYVTGSSL